MNLGVTNPDVEYVRYETPSSFRKSGAFLPEGILDRRLYEYRLSPYMGCSKRCRYCFELHNEFISKDQVKIKTNTPATVRKTLKGMQKKRAVLVDGYDCEEAEVEERLIRRSLEVLSEFRMPLFIQTKSDLVLRDLDLISELNDPGNFVNVSFSLTDLNEGHSEIFEPYACSPGDRMKAMEKVSKEGILTGILLMPVLPFISDTVEELERVFSNAAGAGCQYIVHGPLRVTGAGPQRDMVFGALERHFPDLVERYERLYPRRPDGPRFGAGPADPGYLEGLSRNIGSLAERYGVPVHFPRTDLKEEPAVSRYQNTLDGFL